MFYKVIKFNFFTACRHKTVHDSINRRGWDNHDGGDTGLHPEPIVRLMGWLLDRVNPGRSHGVHVPVGGQLGHNIDDQPHHVHRVLCRLLRPHILRVHVVESREPEREDERRLAPPGLAHLARIPVDDIGDLCVDDCTVVYLRDVLQDSLPGDVLWSCPRAPATPRAAVHLWPWILQQFQEEPRCPRRKRATDNLKQPFEEIVVVHGQRQLL